MYYVIAQNIRMMTMEIEEILEEGRVDNSTPTGEEPNRGRM